MGLDSFACIGVAETLQGDDTRDSWRVAGSPEGDVLREGRALFADSGCIHCHAISNLNLANGMRKTCPASAAVSGYWQSTQ